MGCNLFFYNFVFVMGTFLDRVKIGWRRLKSWISPVFISFMCVSFLFWYILKLQYIYTTDFHAYLSVDGERLKVPCLVEGKGSYLVGYRLNRKEQKVSLSDLKYTIEQERSPEDDGVVREWYVLDPQSVQSAISVRYSDIKIISLGDIPRLEIVHEHGAEQESESEQAVE